MALHSNNPYLEKSNNKRFRSQKTTHSRKRFERGSARNSYAQRRDEYARRRQTSSEEIRERRSRRDAANRHLENPAIHGRGWVLPAQKEKLKRGYKLERHSINFAGRSGLLRAIDPIFIIGTAAFTVIILVVVLIALLAGS